VNIQNAKGKAKPYQVRQVLLALERLREQDRAAGTDAMEKPQ
jgi:hypothetical protein